MIPLQSVAVENLEATLLSASQVLSDGCRQWLAFRFAFNQYYLATQPVCELLVVACVENRAGSMALSCTILPWQDELTVELEELIPEPVMVKRWANAHERPWFEVGLPILLSPIAISKPWGQEIWYTGIEARGQSRVQAQGFSVPLPWLLAVAPNYFVGGFERNINLLKILDPLPEPVYGDLYFELHEKKQEVYVVTNIDTSAWPSGRGGIRFGFNESMRARYDSDSNFKEAYRTAVHDYQRVRCEIDTVIDVMRQQAGIGLDEPVSAAQQKQWVAQLPIALCDMEAGKRKVMEDFTAVKSLQLGDVVKVPCFTPHSLLHGVRTIEFQTPVYERKILSFAQKVLTQKYWDTDTAIKLMTVKPVSQSPLVILRADEQVNVEQIVDFDDFSVVRVVLQPGAQYHSSELVPYQIIMSLSNNVSVNKSPLHQEQAILLPSQSTLFVANTCSEVAVVLISTPKFTSAH